MVGGHFAARYIADPGLIPHAWRGVVAVAAGIIVFLAVSTLTQLINLLALTGPVPSAKRFLTAVGELSAVGAVFGTLLGFRMGAHLFVEAGRDPQRYGLADLLSTVGNGITMMTLFVVAFWWPLAVRPAIESGRSLRGGGSILSFTVLLAGNGAGVLAAMFVHVLLTA